MKRITLLVTVAALILSVWPSSPQAGETTPGTKVGKDAAIRGRLSKEGRPLAGVDVGLCASKRFGDFAGHFRTTTSDDGSYSFVNLRPNTTWYVYGIVSSLREHGAVLPRIVMSGAAGVTNDVGQIEVVKGLRLAGRVQTRDGEPLPAGLKLRASFRTAWESAVADVNAEGRFSFEGLYRETVQMSLVGRGWRFSSLNRGLDPREPVRLTGLLETDKDDLLVVIERGKVETTLYHADNGQPPAPDEPENRPFCGAERSNPLPITLAGTVVDDKNGQPIPICQVLPGYTPPVPVTTPAPKDPLKRVLEPFARKQMPRREWPFWEFARQESVTSGSFVVDFTPLSSTPMLRVEAEDYQPLETEPIPVTTTNLVIRLKRAAGPNGCVELPDGTPAENAAVFYSATGDQCGLDGRELVTHAPTEYNQVTGKDGRFSFTARPHGMELVVVHQAGWANQPVEHGGNGLRLRLQRWAVATGRLVDGTGAPVAGVPLKITLPDPRQNGRPFLILKTQVSTDTQGQFTFLDVPPCRVEIQRIVPEQPGVWRYLAQTWFIARPGVTNDLGDVIYDKPPPPPALETLKRRLGL